MIVLGKYEVIFNDEKPQKRVVILKNKNNTYFVKLICPLRYELEYGVEYKLSHDDIFVSKSHEVTQVYTLNSKYNSLNIFISNRKKPDHAHVLSKMFMCEYQKEEMS